MYISDDLLDSGVIWGHSMVSWCHSMVTSCWRGFLLGPCRAFGKRNLEAGEQPMTADSTMVSRVSVKFGSWHLLLMKIWYDVDISSWSMVKSQVVFSLIWDVFEINYLRKPNMALKKWWDKTSLLRWDHQTWTPADLLAPTMANIQVLGSVMWD